MARNWYDSVVPEDAAPAPCGIDVSVAHPARVYDYLLGGKDNFAADRKAARPDGSRAGPSPGSVDSVPAEPPRSWPGPSASWPPRLRDAASSWTSGPASPPADNTHEVAQAARAGSAGSPTSTTTRSCWRTRGPC